MATPALIPLQQWVCDTCGDLIEDPEHGYTEWVRDRVPPQKERGFRIVHHALYSPRKPYRDCYTYHGSSVPLTDFLGENGMVRILSFLDVGELHATTYPGPEVADLREYVEFVRRLRVPYYEEARRYWSIAEADGFFESANEIWPYIPDNLKMLIERYRTAE